VASLDPPLVVGAGHRAAARLSTAGLVVAVAVAYGLAAATVAARHGTITTYAGTSALAEVVELATGWVLMAAGILWIRARERRVGTLAALAGASWFAGDWAGWDGGPDAVRVVAFATTGFTFVLIFDVVASWGTDRRRRSVRRAITCVYCGTALIALGRLLFRDSLADPHCWSDCTATNPLLLGELRSLVQALEWADVRFAIVAGSALVLICGWRMLKAGAPARARLWPVLVPGAAFGALYAGRGVALLGGRTEDASAAVFAILYGARCLALVCLAGGLVWTLMRARARRAAVARLVDQLDDVPAAGSLASAIATAVGDPSLEVAYWLPSAGTYVAADGRNVDVSAGCGRAATPIVRGRERLAVVLHDPQALDTTGLTNEIGARARLAVDNERLAAEARAQLAELSASRARIVAAADAERRRLERDLHDGAQQRLLALSYDLRVARATAEAAGDDDLSARLAADGAEVQAALDELRALAHGIYPAVLEESGLVSALRTLANRAPLAVELELDASDRAPANAERAAYVTVDEAISDAAGRGASFIAVSLSRAHGALRLAITDDGRPRRGELTRVADRLGALRGTGTFGARTIEAEIPCG
jgi:signal transduction histidine kinase